MEHNVNIREELLQVAPSLAAIGTQMPNRLPDGYFDTLALEVLRTTAFPLQNNTVPEGYFETLPIQLLLKANGQQQQSSTVPQGYFDNFADKMLARVKTLDTQKQDEEEVSPLLKSIGKKTPFSVPAGYFEQITIPVPSIAPLIVEQTAPVVQMRPKRNYLAWAVAACSIGIISLLTWQFVGRSPETVTPGTIALTPNNTSTADTSAATLELAAGLAQLEDNSLQTAISQTGTSDADSHSAVFYLNTDNFEKAVKDLSDEELEQYLLEATAVSKKS